MVTSLPRANQSWSSPPVVDRRRLSLGCQYVTAARRRQSTEASSRRRRKEILASRLPPAQEILASRLPPPVEAATAAAAAAAAVAIASALCVETQNGQMTRVTLSNCKCIDSIWAGARLGPKVVESPLSFGLIRR